ncbi:hypothetical protein Ddye_018708 [Dipteronia dyeriana]|uniref:Uncharacterized protein n=1 Tax=Dipteronia dyeriana TaxID=168575 RepID=A0AAD9UBM6_9ROSI|nr:hypothetical protein Ddye_018708 [Dipteronia dyeriana]
MDLRFNKAACDGDVKALQELLQEDPLILFKASLSAKETTFNGETLLHLVVKNNNRYEVVISLLSLLDEMVLTNEIINYVDKDGNTILHLTAARKQQQVIIFLLSRAKVNVDAVNASAHTAADISTSMCSSESDNNLDINGVHDDDHQRQINLITPRNEAQVMTKMLARETVNEDEIADDHKQTIILIDSDNNQNQVRLFDGTDDEFRCSAVLCSRFGGIDDEFQCGEMFRGHKCIFTTISIIQM